MGQEQSAADCTMKAMKEYFNDDDDSTKYQRVIKDWERRVVREREEWERELERQRELREILGWGYSSSTRRVNIQSSDGRGQVTKVSYEDKEVKSHVTGAVSTSETVREGKDDKVKVTTQKGSQDHKKQEPVTTSAETTSYATASKKDICTSSGFSSTPATLEQSPTLAFSPPPPPPPLAPPAAAPPPPSTSPTPPEAKDEVTQLAQKLLKAVNTKKKSDQDSLNVLSEHLGGSVIMIQNTVNNNHYHTHYHNHNNTCEEVRVETSETVNVCVGGPLKVYQQRQPQDDDNGDEDVDENSHGTDSDKENGDDEDNDDHTMYVDLDDENMDK